MRKSLKKFQLFVQTYKFIRLKKTASSVRPVFNDVCCHIKCTRPVKCRSSEAWYIPPLSMFMYTALARDVQGSLSIFHYMKHLRDVIQL